MNISTNRSPLLRNDPRYKNRLHDTECRISLLGAVWDVAIDFLPSGRGEDLVIESMDVCICSATDPHRHWTDIDYSELSEDTIRELEQACIDSMEAYYEPAGYGEMFV